VRPRLHSSTRRRRRAGVLLALSGLAAGALTACGGGASSTSGTPTLNWYINPNSSGSLQQIADHCVQQANGAYKININVLPATADGQREQIVRRLAAGDTSMDVIMIDPPYMPEAANAGWLMSFTDEQKAQLLKDVFPTTVPSATWQGKLYGAPMIANTQLLWYKKSVAEKAGVDPTSPTFTWDQMIDAAVKTGTTVEEQGKRYEGYMVWVNAMVLGAGGAILEKTDLGRNAEVTSGSPAAQRAVQVIHKLATSSAADPSLSTADEEIGRHAFQTPKGGFMLNWPYVYAAMQADVKAGSLSKSVFDDVGWAPYPRVDADKPAKPPLGGINVGISAYSTHKQQAYQFLTCLVSPESEKIQLLVNGDPEANSTVYDDPEVKKAIPMADLIKDSIAQAGPRPVSPFYGDVSGAIQRVWHEPSQVGLRTPAVSATLISAVLHDQALL
jgi:multiple sugar transport system substrate-binding protein